MLIFKSHNELDYRIFEGYWNVQQVRDTSNMLYVFGDNDMRVGSGGQACIRNEPNAVGLRTKGTPGIEDSAYWTDENFARNVVHFEQDLTEIFRRAHISGAIIVLAAGGYGTGLAYLNKTAPSTFAYISRRLEEVFGFDNVAALDLYK